ncbi:NAC domain-containing protein 53-like isoform X3 [Salvia splendens]|uniref:NAC domain-containing protein 53-like isoform X3 n=1 Tax=Salvia splendens TaxID=180675 RepID=UPI001C251B21|nr:NAC domain-containing protein 53-like isoform X3 [Salvia splendens]
MELVASGNKPSRLPSLLGPGFRFHPTDEELVQYYLRRKSSGKGFRFDAITDVDVYKAEPWDLPYMSKMKNRDLEWYFFSFLDKKYGNGARTNRATEKGYWKTTGKDRPIYHKRQMVGMKKTLVYHCGRAPKGQRSNWVMHEYRLAASESETAKVAKDSFVVCRIFKKSGSGPKNGEQYGAPFVEEEWDDDEFELVPQDEATNEIDFGDNTYMQELNQIIESDVPLNMTPVSSDGSHDCEAIETYNNLQIIESDVLLNMTPVSSDGSHDCEAVETFSGTQNPLESAGDSYCQPRICYDQNIPNWPASYDTETIPVNHADLGECSKSGNSDSATGDLSFLLDEPFLDSFEKFLNDDDGFIEANDLSKPHETNTGGFEMLAEYLDAGDDDSSLYFACDPFVIFGNEDLASNQALLPQMNMGNGTEQAMLPSGPLIDNNNFNAVFSPEKQASTESQSDFQHPYIKQASRMLGDINAPPAYAAEFPSKDTMRRLNSVVRSPSSVHVSGSTIQVRNLTMGGKGTTDQSSGNHKDFNIVLSFGFSHADDGSSSLDSSVYIVPGKSVAAISRGWLCFIFFWILIFSMMSFSGLFDAILHT